MRFTTLISTSDLAAFTSPNVVVDCRFALDNIDWGEREYESAHIPGAVYAHLDRDLAGAKTGTNGRHPLPHPDALSATFARLGIADGIQVVAYDQNNGVYASRLWWLLRWMGHAAVAVLDGGFAKWIEEGRPTASGREENARVRFTGRPHDDAVVDAAAVAASLETGTWHLVDARAPERFRGDIEPLDRVAGHIPGATDHFYQLNVDDRGVFKSPEELRALWSQHTDHPARQLVCYCGSGVTACHNLLALEHAGMHGARLYAGSWSEWSSDPLRPVAHGA